MSEKTKDKITNGEDKKVSDKAKSKNAVIVLILIVIMLLILVGIAIMQQANMQKTENSIQNNTNLNNEDNVQNVQDNTVVDVYQEEKNKDEQQVEQDKKDESVTGKDNETTESKNPQKEETEKIEIDFDEIADKLFEAYGIKEEVDKLPQVTAEERPKYEKVWNDMVAEKNDELVQIIKKKYPTLSDKQAGEYATKVFQYIKEYGLRIAKHSEQVIDDAKDAIETADKADALADFTIKYTEILTNHMQTDPTQSYKVNETDLKILQQYVMEKTDGKYTVIIKEDESGYDVEKVAN